MTFSWFARPDRPGSPWLPMCKPRDILLFQLIFFLCQHVHFGAFYPETILGRVSFRGIDWTCNCSRKLLPSFLLFRPQVSLETNLKMVFPKQTHAFPSLHFGSPFSVRPLPSDFLDGSLKISGQPGPLFFSCWVFEGASWNAPKKPSIPWLP